MLVSPGQIVLWGNGCLAAARTVFEIAPWGDGWWIDIDIRGPERPEAERASLALDAAEAVATLAALLAEPPRGRADTDRSLTSTGIGTIYLKLPLPDGLADLFVSGDEGRLIAIAGVLLELVRRAGLRVDETLHPLPGHQL